MTAIAEDEILDALPPAQRDELARVLDEYLVSLERGVPLPWDDVVAGHPQLAEPLRLYGESLRLLCLAGDQLGAGRAMAPAAGNWNRHLGDYQLLREIGRGGMGVVYEAEQLSLGRRVALKVLPFAAVMDEKQRLRFTNEARAAAQLNHPNIVPVYGVGNERGIHYYSMQFIHGQPLDRLIGELRDRADAELGSPASGEQTAACGKTVAGGSTARWGSDSGLGCSSLRDRGYYRNVAQLGIQAAEALHHAHEQGVVHRDIKPSNLLLDASGKIWITDFGLAHVAADTNVTQSGAVLGTARYMSPEQAAGRTHLVDHRADVYALGITLYELLTLRPAFDAASPQHFLRQIERDEPLVPRRVNPLIPADLETIVLKAIAKPREARYQTAGELAEDLRRFLDGRPTLARRPTLLDRCGKWSQRHANLVAALAAVLLVALLATGVSTTLVARQKQQTEAALHRAQHELQRAETNYAHARHVVDRYGLRLAEELAAIPGVEPLRRELLEDSWQWYELLLRQAQGDPALRAEQAMAHFQAAEIAAQLGDPRRAVQQYTAARDLFAALAREQDGAVASRSHLGLCYNNLGLVLSGSGQRAAAQQAFRQAEEQLVGLCREAPEDASHPWRLALVHTNQGLLHSEAGAVEAAEACYSRAIEMLEPLAERQPQRGEFRKDLAVAYNNRGALHRVSRPDRAAEDNGRALELLAQLAQQHPDRLDYQSEWALCQSNQGVLLAEIRSTAAALPVLRQAIAIQAALVRKAPARVDYRRDLAVSQNNLGRVLLDAGQLEAADLALEQAQTLLLRLAADFPDTVEHWTGAGGVLNNRAMLRQQRGDLVQAALLFEQAMDSLHRARALSGDAREPREFLEQTRENHAGVLQALERERRGGADTKTARREAFEVGPQTGDYDG